MRNESYTTFGAFLEETWKSLELPISLSGFEPNIFEVRVSAVVPYLIAYYNVFTIQGVSRL